MIVQSPEAMRNVRRLIWLYFWLWIFEGALRKWVVPQLSAPILIIRDPVAIAAYFLAFKGNFFPKDIFTKAIIGLAFISLLGGLATVITADSNLIVTLFGIRTNFLHLPLIFLIAKVFSRDDVKKMGKWVLILTVPMAILMVCQFNSPPEAFINRTAGVGEAQQLSSALGKIRTPGTFSFVTGAAQYLSLAASFLIYGLFQRKVYPYWLLLPSAVALVAGLAVSGSRSAVGSVGTVLVSLLIALLIRPSLIGNSYKFFALVAVVAFGVSYVPSFNEGLEVLNARVETANSFEASSGGILGRFFRGFSESFAHIDEIPLLGYGLGMGTNVGATLLTGKPQFLLSEGEWGRVLYESGPVLGLLYILLRIVLIGWMSFVSLKKAAEANILPLLLLSICALLLLTGQFSRSTDVGFAVLGAGLCLASTKSLFKKSKQPNENLITRQLLT